METANQAINLPASGLRTLGRLCFAYCAFAIVFHFAGVTYGKAVFPAIKTGLELAHPDLRLRSSAIRDGRMEFVVLLNANSKTKPRHVANVAFPVSQLLVPPILLFTLLVGWPRKGLQSKTAALVFAVPLLALLAALDTPNVIAAVLAERFAGQNNAPKDLLSFWWFCLDNGGRQFLGILAAFLAAKGARLWSNRMTPSKAAPALAPARRPYRRAVESHVAYVPPAAIDYKSLYRNPRSSIGAAEGPPDCSEISAEKSMPPRPVSASF